MVWVTKYRYRILVGDIGRRARELIQEVCQDNNTEREFRIKKVIILRVVREM